MFTSYSRLILSSLLLGGFAQAQGGFSSFVNTDSSTTTSASTTSTTTLDSINPLSSSTNTDTVTSINPLGPLSTIDLGSTTLTITLTTSATTTPTDLPTSSTDSSTVSPLSSTSSFSSSTSTASSGSSIASSHTSTGAIAGGVVGGVFGLGLIAGAIFLFLRRRRARNDRDQEWRGRRTSAGGDLQPPPSPRLRNSWIGTGMAAVERVAHVNRKPAAQRLGSVGGESMRNTPSNSNHGHGPNASEDGYASRNVSGSISGGVVGAISSSMGRHRSSASKGSVSGAGAGVEDGRGTQRSSYDLNVFSTGSAPNHSRQSDPFDPMVEKNATAGADLARGPSITTSRLIRKPVPRYDGDPGSSASTSEPVTPISPRDRANTSSSKPPVSGPPRTRTYSNGSHGSYQTPSTIGRTGSVAPSSSRNSFETAHNVERKDSQSTLGGAFKFAGEKEGPIHYLIPDPPPSSSI